MQLQQKKLMKAKLLTGMALLAIMATSCKDDVTFDPNGYNKLAKSSFVVENTDPKHDWATVGSAQVNATINGDYGTTYNVGIYLENPIGAQKATLLYEEQVVSGSTINCTVSYPKNHTTLYVGMFDKDGRGVAQAVQIVDGVANAVIGGSGANARRAQEDASVYSSYVKTLNDYLNPSKALIGDDNATIETITVDEMKAYNTFTDADINSDNGYVNSGVNTSGVGGDTGSSTSGGATVTVNGETFYKIPADFNPADGEKVTLYYTDGSTPVGTISFHGTGGASVADGTHTNSGLTHKVTRPYYILTTYATGGITFYHKSRASEGKELFGDNLTGSDILWGYGIWQNNPYASVTKGSSYKIHFSDDTPLEFFGLKYYANDTYTIPEESGSASEESEEHGIDVNHLRVASGTTITKYFHLNNTTGIYNRMVVYVEGKLHLNGNTLNSPTIVVANGGEVIIDGNIEMSNAGRFIVMPGGKITGSKGVVAKVCNGAPCYNGGTIEFDGELNVNGSDLYNAASGRIKVDMLRNTSGKKFTNFGHIEARTNTIQGDAYNCALVNGCYMKFTESGGVGNITMLDNSRLDCGGQLYMTGNNTLYNRSVINAATIYCQDAAYAGPTADDEFGVVKTGAFLVSHGGDLTSSGYAYFDVNMDSLCNYYGTPYKETVSAENYQYTAAAGVESNMHYHMREQSTLDNYKIPAGECTGAGYNPKGNTGGAKPVTTTAFSMRWCFEDNFPDFGDYDFNDVVLTVTPAITGDTLRIRVSLDAVGATENIGACIRLDGINSSMLKDYYVEQDFTAMPASWKNIDNIQNNGKPILRENEECNNTSNMVVVLFKNAHWAINPVEDPNGGAKVSFYNTVKTDNAYENKKYVTPKEAVYTFVFNSADKAKDMADQRMYDVFIVEPYNGAYWEVHTVQNNFKALQVVTPLKPDGYDWYATNADTGNLPWAIMVPGDFKYPIEWTPIGRGTEGLYTGAYRAASHSFAAWARNRTEATDWYNYPDSESVFDFGSVSPKVTD